MNKFHIVRADGVFEVLLMQNKEDKTYSFINITKEHICPCRFKTIEDAIADLNSNKKVLKYIHVTGSREFTSMFGDSMRVEYVNFGNDKVSKGKQGDGPEILIQ